MHRTIRNTMFSLLALSSSAVLCSSPIWAAGTEPQGFATPDEASIALVKAVESGDSAAMTALFGSGHEGLLSSGDAVEDKNNREGFVATAKEKLAIENVGGDKAIIHTGNNGWPFPIPLVKRGSVWQFDAVQGEDEIINRRIGRNEMRTLSAIQGYVEAQADYAELDRDGDGVFEYAQKLASSPGLQDGLFWETAADQPESPLGPLFAEARAAGYDIKGKTEKPTPYRGYYYRILTRQGPAAAGGKYDYLINGNMIAGFGLVAFPASYGASGVMTFIVNHQGRIYQKDLGPKTTEIVEKIKEFNPDQGWQPVVLSD